LPFQSELKRPPWVEPHSEGALGSYLRSLRAHRVLFGAVVLAVLAGSLAWLAVRTPEYQASAQLLINPLPQEDETFLGLSVIRDSGDPTRTIQTAATLLHSSDAAGLTARRIGGGATADDVLRAVEVQAEGQSNIVAITAHADDAAEATRLANTFAQSTLDVRAAALRKDIDRLVQRLEDGTLGTDAAARADVEGRLATLKAARTSGDPTTLLAGTASVPSAPEGAPAWLIAALALLAGLILATGAALLMETLTPRRLREEDELAVVDDVRVLARVPALPRAWKRLRRTSPLVVPSPVQASFRGLQLQLAMQDGNHQTMLFTSASAGDGKTSSVVDFALELADGDAEVILFDLDLRKPMLAQALGVSAQTSLEAALAPGGQLGDALVPVPGLPSISLVPGVADTRLATLELIGERLPDLLAEALAMAAYVLIDTAPLGEVGDALRLVGAVDDVLVVVRLDHTSLASVEVVEELLRRARKPATGYIVVGAGPKGARGSYASSHRTTPATSAIR
jgi:Mrp family chromosome partitioning ATPase/capsular polysaccharide biosynthesis protein